MTNKPPSLYDREVEWDDLIGFATGAGQSLRLGILYGRRRYGKTYLGTGLRSINSGAPKLPPATTYLTHH